MKRVLFFAAMAGFFTMFPAYASSQHLESIHGSEMTESMRRCYVAGSTNRSPSIFGGCSWGNEWIGAGILAGFSHPLPPIPKLALDGEFHFVVRAQLWVLDFEGSVGIGASAATSSASLRTAVIIGTHPHPIGFQLSAFVAHYPRAWNFVEEGENDDQMSVEVRIGPSFRVMSTPSVILTPWLGMEMEDSDEPDHWGVEAAGTIVFRL